MEVDPRLGPLLRRSAMLVALAGVTSTVVLAGLVLTMGEVVLNTTRVTLRALESVEETVAVFDQAAGSLATGLGAANEGLKTAAGSTEELTGVVERVSSLASDDLPESVEAIQDAMPALIEAGAVIDSTLRALSLIGVSYAPEVPFDDALREVDASLEGLPEELRAEGEALAGLVPAIEQVDADLEVLSGELDSLTTELDRIAGIVSEYRTAAEEARQVVESAGTLVGVGRWLAVAGLVAVGALWLAVAAMIRRGADLLTPVDLEPAERLQSPSQG